jgi:hypothetical protein
MKLIFLAYIDHSASMCLSQKLNSLNNILVCPEAEILVDNLLENPGRDIKDYPGLQHRLEYHIGFDAKLKQWELNESCLYQIPSLRTNFDVFWHILDTYRSQAKPEAKFVLFKAERILHLMPKIKRSIALCRFS